MIRCSPFPGPHYSSRTSGYLRGCSWKRCQTQIQGYVGRFRSTGKTKMRTLEEFDASDTSSTTKSSPTSNQNNIEPLGKSLCTSVLIFNMLNFAFNKKKLQVIMPKGKNRTHLVNKQSPGPGWSVMTQTMELSNRGFKITMVNVLEF